MGIARREGWLGTRIGVPVVLVVGAFLFTDELFVHYFFELDHFGGCVRLAIGVGMEEEDV
jgi:hypothetical protein